MSTINSAAENQGMLYMMKNTAIDGVNWCGSVISSGWEGIKNLVSKVCEYARPFFSNALSYISDALCKMKGFLIENKTAAGGVLGAMLVVIVTVFAFNTAFGGSKPAEQASSEVQPQ